jgi:tetratricopeptide (TPR) repeat protein
MMRWLLLLSLLFCCLPVGAQSVGSRNKFKVGRGEFQREKYKEAIKYFEQAIAEDAGYIDAHYMMGLAYYGDKNFAKAEEKLRYVIGLDPQFFPAYQYLGQILSEQKKYDQAKQLFQKMQTVPGAGALPHYALGVVAYQEKNLKLAEKSWQEAARMDPKDPRSRNNLGVLRSAEGKHGDALAQFQMAAKLGPENPVYLFNEAWELVLLSREQQATERLARVRKLSDARHDVGFVALALLAKINKSWEKVVNHCDSCLSRNPEYTQAWMLKGEALEKLSKPTEALESYRKAADSDPNLVDAQKAVERLGAAAPPPSTDKAAPASDKSPTAKPAQPAPKP